MIIPHEQINPETLTAIIEEFVTREGTDYGETSYSLEQKVKQVLAQIKEGKAQVSFDAETQTCSIVAS